MKCTGIEREAEAIWRKMFDRKKEDKSGKAPKEVQKRGRKKRHLTHLRVHVSFLEKLGAGSRKICRNQSSR